jgi:hypothetical protein
MKLEFSLQIFEKYLHVKLHENPSKGSRVAPCGRKDGHTDVTKLIVAFRNFVKAPKTGNQVLSIRNGYATSRGDSDKQAPLDNGEYQII